MHTCIVSHIRRLWPLSCLLIALAVSVCAFTPISGTASRGPWREGLPLRVGAPEPVRQATVLSPYGPGFEVELIHRFCQSTPCSPEWTPVSDKEEGFALLKKGEIDVLVGFWGDEPEQADPENMEEGPEIVAGKAYAHFNPIRIKGAAAPKPTPRQQDSGSSGTPVLETLTEVFNALPFIQSQSSAPPPIASGEDPPFPIFSLMTEGDETSAEDILLVDPASYALWLPFLGDVDTAQITQPTPFRWFWRDDDDEMLGERLAAFWTDRARAEELRELTERYFGFLPRKLRQRDILELAETLSAHLPKYEKFILNAARETGVPPLLLVAAIYQESRFDPSAVSETKVRGIMQLTSTTAKMLDVDRRDPEQCILGGARYLKDLKDRVADKADNEWDRWFMALAAYNQGMSNLNRTIKLSKEIGGSGDTWADLKKAFPLSTTCRGLEARSFVEKIRYYHFILHGLVALAPAESENLAPLLGLALAHNAF